MSVVSGKKIVFVVGMFPDKNSVFLDVLCREFRVVMFRAQYFATRDNGTIEFAEDLLASDAQEFDWRAFCWDLHQAVELTESAIAEILPGTANPALSEEEFSRLYTLSFQTSYLAHAFEALATKIGVDFVIANADCSAIRRCIVVKAKQLGIPTLDIEHGFNHSLMPEPELLRQDFVPYPMFISDYVNLDNELEAGRWQAYYKHTATTDIPRFLTWGTPNTISSAALTKAEARDRLGIDPAMPVITVAGTWNEARDVSVVLDALLGEGEFYQSAFAAIARVQHTAEAQVLVKLHPAYAREPLLSDCRCHLEHLAESLGMQIALIAEGGLSEVLSASDVIVCPTDSSILWEAFLVGVPGIILPASGFFHRFFLADELGNGNVLAKAGWLQYVFSRSALEEAIRHFLNPDAQELGASRQEICERYGLELRTAEQKSERLVRWMKGLLDGQAAGRALSGKLADTVSRLFESGKTLIEAGSLREGLTVLNKLLDLDGTHAPTLQLLSSIYRDMGQEEAALGVEALLTDGTSESVQRINRLSIAGVRPELTGLVLQLECSCGQKFEVYQATVAGLAFATHACPGCSATIEVGPEMFEEALERALAKRSLDDISRLNAEATRIVESWYRQPPFCEALKYRGLNAGEPAELGLLPHVLQALEAHEN